MRQSWRENHHGGVGISERRSVSAEKPQITLVWRKRNNIIRRQKRAIISAAARCCAISGIISENLGGGASWQLRSETAAAKSARWQHRKAENGGVK